MRSIQFLMQCYTLTYKAVSTHSILILTGSPGGVSAWRCEITRAFAVVSSHQVGVWGLSSVCLSLVCGLKNWPGI